MKSIENNIETDFVEASQPAEKGEPYLSPEEMLNFWDEFLKDKPNIYDEWLYTAEIWRNTFLYDKLRNKYEAVEILHIVIDRFFNGRRKWYYKKYPDFSIYLKMVIKSVVYEIACREEKFADNEYLNEDGELTSIFDNIAEKEIEDILKKNDFEEFVERALDVFSRDGSDVESRAVFLCIYEGNTENRNIASELGMQVEDVVNAKKRIRRKLIGLYSQFYHGKENN